MRFYTITIFYIIWLQISSSFAGQNIPENSFQYRMIKKVSKGWLYPLHKEAYFNSKANIWNLYSYLHPYELVIQDLGTDLFECKYYWQKLKTEFKQKLLKQNSKQQISASDIELELTKYDSIHRDIIRSILKQIVKQLIDLADEGICHYDIKPSNMVVDNSGIASLIDFGLSVKKKNCNLNLTDGKFIEPDLCGTLSYLSPEIINHKYFSFKKESWALGLTLFWLLENNAGYVCNIGSLVEVDIKTLKFSLQNYQFLYNYIINSTCIDKRVS